MNFRLCEQQLNIQDLIEFESSLRIELPEKFKSFYIENNGGIPSHSYFEGKSIKNFLSIKYGKRNIADTFERLLNHDVLTNPKHIPFAHDPGGWYYILDLNEGINYGKVYIVQLDSEEHILVAESFSYFISSCSEEDNW